MSPKKTEKTENVESVENNKNTENIENAETSENLNSTWNQSEKIFDKWKVLEKKFDKKFERKPKEEREFSEKLVEVRKVTNVTTWWRKMSFRATILVWNKNGKIGLGIGKWIDVSIAVKKATNDAYKNIKTVLITNEWSVLYPLLGKKKTWTVKILPAASGTGIKAGSSVRQVLDIAWYKNIISKIMWWNNKINNISATIDALYGMKLKPSHIKFVSNQSDAEKELLEKRKQTSEQKDMKKKPFKNKFDKKPNISKKPTINNTENKWNNTNKVSATKKANIQK